MFVSSHLKNEELTKRAYEIKKDGLRDYYEYDIDQILNSKVFSRLRHKTQVFFDPKNDHICTRMEHSLQVAYIARTIAKKHNLNSSLAEAIGLAHDLGHAPFGHAGEELIDSLLLEKILPSIGDTDLEKYFLKPISFANEKTRHFFHNINGFLWASEITNDGKGLNLTYAVLDGILSHCSSDVPDVYKFEIIDKNKKDLMVACREKKIGLPVTIEGCIVRLADVIAFRTRDYADCVRAGILTENQLPSNVKKRLGERPIEMVETLIRDLLDPNNENTRTTPTTQKDMKLTFGFSREIIEVLNEFDEFYKNEVYQTKKITQYKIILKSLIFALYDYLVYQVEIHGGDKPLEEIEKTETSDLVRNFYKLKNKDLFHNWPIEIKILYFLSGCSDKFIRRGINDCLILI